MPAATSLNASDYGLISGSSDQTTNLQAAINAAQSQKLPLFLPEGSFPITTVNITAPIEIYSAAQSAQILGFGGTSPAFNIAPSVAGNRFGPVTIRDIYFNGSHQPFSSGSDPAIIFASEIDNIYIRDCWIQDSGNHGICLSNCKGWIQNNEIPGSLIFGILNLESAGATFIDQNKVSFSGNGGIYFYRASNASDQGVISNNQIGFTSATNGGTGQYGNAITVASCNYVKIINNMIYTSAFSAIRCSDSSNVEIIGNQCYDSTENAIYVEAPGSTTTWYAAIIANNRVDQCGSGISTGNSNFGARGAVISGNFISGCHNNTITYPGGSYQTWGRGIGAEADSLIANNQIDGADDWGIFVYPTSSGSLGAQKILASVESNMIKNCAGGIGFYKDDTAYSRLIIGSNIIDAFTTTSTYAAIVPVSYNGATGAVAKLPGATDLGNATSSGFANVILTQNFSFS